MLPSACTHAPLCDHVLLPYVPLLVSQPSSPLASRAQAAVERQAATLQRCADALADGRVGLLRTAHERERARALCAHVCAAYICALHALRRPVGAGAGDGSGGGGSGDDALIAAAVETRLPLGKGAAVPSLHATAAATNDDELPPPLSALLSRLSALVGRPAQIDFVDLTLYNWTLSASADESAESQGVVSMERAGRVRLVCRFLAIPEEEAFWRLHIVLEAEARALVGAIMAGLAAMAAKANADCRALIDSLEQVGLALAKLSECHARLFADGGRRDVVLARRLRPFLLAGVAGETHDLQLGCLYYSQRCARGS
jgi:hypothetical protein